MLITLIILGIWSCTPEPLPNPCPNTPCDTSAIMKDSILQLVWQISLREDREYTVGEKPIIMKDYINFSYDAISQEKMLFIAKKDNSVQRFYGPNKGDYKDRFYRDDVGIIAIDYLHIFTGTDPDHMKMIASTTPELQYGSNNNLIGNFLYLYSRDDLKKENYVKKVNIITGHVTTDRIVKDNEFPDYEQISIASPSYYTNPNYDTILNYSFFLWKNSWAEDYTDSKLLTNNDLIWTKNKKKLSTWQRNMISYGKSLISIISDTIYSFNPYNGNFIWKKGGIHSGYAGWAVKGAHLLNRTISLLDQGHYVEIDAQTGATLYDSPEIFTPQSNSEMTYFEGIFYWTAAHKGYSWIYGLRASDHKVVLKMKSPNQGKAPYFDDPNYDWNGLQIDPETRLGYTADGFYAQCFKIPLIYK